MMTEKMYIFDGKEYSKSELEKLFSLGKTSDELSQRVQYAIDMIEGNNVLDVGCVSGTITKKIAEIGHKVLGIDVLKSSIEIAKDFNKHPMLPLKKEISSQILSQKIALIVFYFWKL